MSTAAWVLLVKFFVLLAKKRSAFLAFAVCRIFAFVTRDNQNVRSIGYRESVQQRIFKEVGW
jgi:hypothetical protein